MSDSAGVAQDMGTHGPAARLARLARWSGRAAPTRRDWIVDTLFVVLPAINVAFSMFLATATATATGTPGGSARLSPATVVLAFAACGSLWFRHRRPVLLTCLLALLSLIPGGDSLSGATMFALFTVGVHRRARVSVPLGIAIVTVSAIRTAWVSGYLGAPADPRLSAAYLDPAKTPTVSITAFTWITWGSAVTVVTLVLGVALTVRARRRQGLRRAERVEAEYRAQVERARETERRRIAWEMHDVLAHRISLVSAHAGTLEADAADLPSEVVGAVSVIRSNAHLAMEELWEVIGVLRTDGAPSTPSAPQATVAQVPELVENARGSGTPVSYRCTLGDPAALPALPALVELTIYRVVQEGLTNARKHAPGTGVEVVVDGRPGDGVRLVVANAPPDPRRAGAGIPGAGLGLVGMAERVALAGGRLVHGPTPAGGFELVAHLPWPAADPVAG